MCPIYKKKERTEIANYRPITLLNTDYKLLTKALAIQLAKAAPKLIHPDQSGFIPNRSIFDPIRLAKMMIEYADISEEDGALIALDQEKAYDRISHDYLIETLQTFNLPTMFINAVKALYSNAHTRVAINGMLSEPFKVTRGVRQGDPLSCLLFNLAIEPLACTLRNSNLIKGYDIPGITHRVKINLYADDTTIYLNKNDKYSDLENILNGWCLASGAKFNMDKTEIIPIGSKTHRERVITTRKLNPDDTPLENSIRIAPDGHPIRSLGAWIGNETNDATPWEPILDNISKTLNRWNKGHPSLDGKRLIAQMVIGGMTQFLAKAQGMPKNIETALTRMMRNFIWNNKKTSPINLEQLQKPRTEGGINLIDLKARNEAIEITWLRSYLDLSKKRPAWAFLADIIINNLKPTGISNTTDLNTFLQSWSPPTKGTRANNTPKEIINMLKIAKKYNVSFAPIKLSKQLKKQLPAWYHLGAPPKTYHKQKDNCLQNNHKAQKIKHLIKISKRISLTNNETTDNNKKHYPRKNCACKYCKKDRNKGCENPHKCAITAKEILNKIAPKFNTKSKPKKDNLSLTHSRKEKNQQAHERRQGEIIFDPTITIRTTLGDCFRIFTDPSKQSERPAHRLQAPMRGLNIIEESITIYTDGSCLNNGKYNARSGSGIWVSAENERNKKIRIPGHQQSNQIAEITAILVALQQTEPYIPITFITDSKYAIDGLTKHIDQWEDKGWIDIANSEYLKATLYHLRKRSAQTSFIWTKGHNGNQGNEQADRLALEGVNKLTEDQLDLSIPDEWNLQGAKISSISQSLAYKGIKKQNETKNPPRRATTSNLDIARYAIQEITGNLEHDSAIWTGCRNKDIQKTIRQFLFKAIHRAYHIGEYWLNIPNYEHRAKCATCHAEIESLEHILLECPNNPQKTIWKLTKDIWPTKLGAWPRIKLGTILGCGNLQLKKQIPEERDPNEREDNDNEANNKTKGAARLLRILISESAYLIWIIRCDSTINEKTYTTDNIIKRWTNRINNRLQLDRISAKKIIRTKQFTKLVTHTWENIIQTNPNNQIQKDWATALEVLVGIRPPRPSTTEAP
jgi:ribonuclease HI